MQCPAEGLFLLLLLLLLTEKFCDSGAAAVHVCLKATAVQAHFVPAVC
jgi:hypothetical protein